MNELSLRNQRMTSLEIAEVTEKQHKNVMQSIRNMEAAWERTCGLKFQLTSREVEQPNGGIRVVPCYDLTKTECLYIATKFNDEAQAKLVLRWEQLEKERNATRYTLHLLRTILSRLGIVDASITLPSLLQKVTFSNLIRLC